MSSCCVEDVSTEYGLCDVRRVYLVSGTTSMPFWHTRVSPWGKDTSWYSDFTIGPGVCKCLCGWDKGVVIVFCARRDKVWRVLRTMMEMLRVVFGACFFVCEICEQVA